MLRLAFDFIITWRETRTRPNAYSETINKKGAKHEHILIRKDFTRTTLSAHPAISAPENPADANDNNHS